MKNLYFVWGTGLAFLLALGAGTACSSDEDDTGTGGAAGAGGGGTGGGGTGGGGTGGGGTGGGGTGGTDSGTGGGGTGGGDSGPGLTCAAYCTAIAAACTGADEQYADEASCLAACASFPVGDVSDTTGNTLGCRTYHAGVAAGSDKTHCDHAGPSGASQCGDICDGYCNLMVMYCPDEYADTAECSTKCAALTGANATDYSSGDTTGDSVACRLYHANAAAIDPTQPSTTHCPHAGESPTDQCI